ncbi:transcription factor HEC2-like [Pistacia vera]|uniref:transcription factor HEC2-like n=1 Tax=Pistacia vera TaxID=55513 RepID=UPI0012630606|nr:transcription factor HEC2-like [Pistacia vera]
MSLQNGSQAIDRPLEDNNIDDFNCDDHKWRLQMRLRGRKRCNAITGETVCPRFDSSSSTTLLLPPHHPPFNNSSSSPSSSRNCPRFDSSVCPNHVLLPSVQPQRELARQRRQNNSDNVRCLQKLMPCEKKMDTATTLEEAYKYVRFLQSQVNTLQSMPLESSFALQNEFFSFSAVLRRYHW